jgi:hypothetical protein
MVIRTANDTMTGFDVILLMHGGSDRSQLVIGQYDAALIVMNGDDYSNRKRLPRLSVKNVFSPASERLVTITSGEQGTRLYLDGTFVAAGRALRLIVSATGKRLRLLLGRAIYGNAAWTGDIHGIAIYGNVLSDQDVKDHNGAWTIEKRFDFPRRHQPLLNYSFLKMQGNRVPDHSGGGQFLEIPLRQKILQKRFLSIPWRDFKLSRTLIQGNRM